MKTQLIFLNMRMNKSLEINHLLRVMLSFWKKVGKLKKIFWIQKILEERWFLLVKNLKNLDFIVLENFVN